MSIYKSGVWTSNEIQEYNLPLEYQEVEYIESTGTQYIDTGAEIFDSTSHAIYVDFVPTLFYNYNTIYGSTRDADTNEGWIYSTGALAARYGNVRYGNDNVVTVNSRIELELKRQENALSKIVNGSNIGTGTISATSTGSVLLFLSGTDYGRYKLFSCKLSKDGVLVRYFIPCIRKSDNEVGLYDLIEGVFYTNQGTGEFKYSVNGIPSDYKELEYIESTGGQYIQTDYVPNYNTQIYCKFAHNEETIDTPVFGCRTSGYANNYVLWSHPTGYTSGVSQAIFNGTTRQTQNYAMGTIIEFYYCNNSGKYHDVNWVWAPSSGTPDVNMTIFTIKNGSNPDGRRFSGKMWAFKIWENDILIRDFVPSQRVEDDAVGLYDKVNGIFYTNSGSGSFTAGIKNDKFNPIAKIYKDKIKANSFIEI